MYEGGFDVFVKGDIGGGVGDVDGMIFCIVGDDFVVVENLMLVVVVCV